MRAAGAPSGFRVPGNLSAISLDLRVKLYVNFRAIQKMGGGQTWQGPKVPKACNVGPFTVIIIIRIILELWLQG